MYKSNAFLVKNHSSLSCWLTQVVPTSSALNTNDVFVLKSPNSLFIWKGKGASQEEIAAAKYVASLLGGTPTEVEETKEPCKCQTNKLQSSSSKICPVLNCGLSLVFS